MKKPTCYICQGKVTDNSFIWLPNERKLVHIMCYKLRKDITVYVQPVQMGIRVKEV